ncbi:unnamed protein product [Arctia plantaginis]|uniref:Uncharacterized protein n=1 Tax=Arctia plantaginis TaxID=874455 RepID=A0A8S0ZYH5_ARCPL|nr:unnamed protein product [Arctia plantaginis]
MQLGELAVCVRFSRLEILMRRATAIKNERLGKREYISERDGARPARSATLRRDASRLLRYVLYTALYFDSF